MSAQKIAELMRDAPRLEPGHVWLAGAGPGDPGMVTLDVANALGQAEVVVYDALVDRRILVVDHDVSAHWMCIKSIDGTHSSTTSVTVAFVLSDEYDNRIR